MGRVPLGPPGGGGGGGEGVTSLPRRRGRGSAVTRSPALHRDQLGSHSSSVRHQVLGTRGWGQGEVTRLQEGEGTRTHTQFLPLHICIPWQRLHRAIPGDTPSTHPAAAWGLEVKPKLPSTLNQNETAGQGQDRPSKGPTGRREGRSRQPGQESWVLSDPCPPSPPRPASQWPPLTRSLHTFCSSFLTTWV